MDFVTGIYLVGALIGGIISLIAVDKNRPFPMIIFLVLLGAGLSWITVVATFLIDRGVDKEMRL